MPPISVYADTSVYGGVFDKEFKDLSTVFFEQVREGRFRLFISDLLEVEIMPAPPAVRDVWSDVSREAEVLRVSEEVYELTDAYLAAGIVSDRSREDAMHVALATVGKCTTLVSWNYKHIVHRDKAPRYNAVNAGRGLPTVGIYSPAEVIEYEKGF